MSFLSRPLIILGLLSLSALSYAASPWKHNTEIFFAAGDDASLTGIRWLQPWWQNGNSLAFSDLRFLKSDQSTEEFNLGGGYRYINSENSVILGGYGFWDYRLSATNNKFSQITVGGEVLLDKWEVRANIYSPLKDEYIIESLPSTTTNTDSFVGNTLTRVTTSVPGGILVEEALEGYDFEVGYLLPGKEDFEIRANLGLYQFEAPIAGEAKGVRARIESFPRENFRVSLAIESDDLFDTRSFLEVALPLGKKIGQAKRRSMHQRMTQFAYRDIDVRETSRLDSKKRIKNGPGTAQAIANTTTSSSTLATGIAHIDSSRSINNPDGSIERPYKSITQCKNSTSALNCSGSAKTIYLHANKSATSNGIPQTYIGNITLGVNQSLIGDGASSGTFANVSSGVSPILLGSATSGASTPVITMNSNSTVMGAQIGWDFIKTSNNDSNSQTFVDLPTIDGETALMPNKAVFAHNADNIIIRDVKITGMSSQTNSISDARNFATGIHILSDNNSGEDSTSIHTVSIDAVLGDAVYAEMKLSSAGTDEQNIFMRDISIQRSGRGIHASVTGVDNSFAKQDLRVISSNQTTKNLVNQIQLNFNEGILVENINALNTLTTRNTATPTPLGSFTATQELLVENTSIENNQGAGIQTLFGPTGKDSFGNERTSTVTLNRNNISQNDGSGLVLGSYSSKVTADLKNIRFTGNLLRNRLGGNSYGKRLDFRPIDCGTSAAENSDSCSTPGDNQKRFDLGGFNYRQTGYGIYAMNKDDAGAPSTQLINISEDFTNTLHSTSNAQIFLESIDLTEGTSQQKISLRPIANEPRKLKDPSTTIVRQFDTTSGIAIRKDNGNFDTQIQAGASTPQIAFCDNDSGNTSTNTDNASPHIPVYEGDLSSLPKIERCP